MNVLKPWRAAKSAFLYVRAGIAFDEGNYPRGRRIIYKAIASLGSDAGRPSLFDFYIRAALIEDRLGRRCDALENIKSAISRIETCTRLSDWDRLYLLDFCDVFAAELRGQPKPYLRLKPTRHNQVSERLRKEYPLLTP